MDTDRIAANLMSSLGRLGFKAALLPIRRLPDLQRDFTASAQAGRGYYWHRSSYFNFAPPGSLPDARSIVVVAAPQPRVRVTFYRDGWEHRFIIPPTYDYGIDEKIKEAIRRALAPEGFRAAGARLPEKLAAVRSGLAEYGRNNVTYVDGLGSFHRLKAYCTDLPASEERWEELRLMAACEKCSACIERCPTGAIDRDRFLIRIEKCLTYHNEAYDEFPAWIDPAWHNCLIGCMYCQLVCPENRQFVDSTADGEEFSEEETRLILDAAHGDELPPQTADKLRRLYLFDEFEIVPRNLRALLDGATI